MKTAYDILDVTEQATDAEIKQAYLHQVKLFPPDHYDQQFQQIQQAYQTIKDLESRSKYALFTIPEADFNDLLEHAFSSGQATAISAEQFQKLLCASVDDQTFMPTAAETTKTL